MINAIVINFFRFVFLVLLQVLILNNIQLGGYINPYLYVLFILSLPFDTPVALVMVLSFALGLSVDMFMNTAGMHAAACVLMGYLRSYVLKLIAPREGYEFSVEPNLQNLGPKWYLSYTAILVSFHHLVLFYIEVFRFSEFFSTLFRVILSTIFTLLLVFGIQFLLYKNKNR